MAARANTRAWSKPRQQFIRMKRDRMTNHNERTHTAAMINPATPTKPITVATIRLRARPRKNQSSERRICPPSKG